TVPVRSGVECQRAPENAKAANPTDGASAMRRAVQGRTEGNVRMRWNVSSRPWLLRPGDGSRSGGRAARAASGCAAASNVSARRKMPKQRIQPTALRRCAEPFKAELKGMLE